MPPLNPAALPCSALQMLNVYMQQEEDLVLNGGKEKENEGPAAAAAGPTLSANCAPML